ncbi:2080_t:CDS:2, partial [Paraglomus occultum]
NNPTKSYEEIGRKFGIGKSTVGDIIKEKEKWLAITESSINANKKRNRGGEWPQVEEALAIWVNLANEANQSVTGLGCNFKKRNNIKEYYKLGEAASVPINELPMFRTELRSIISQYDLEDVYNADET